MAPDLDGFMNELEEEADRLRQHARLREMPSVGNRLMLELAVYTAASDRVLRAQGVMPDVARAAVADMAWDIYRRMLGAVSLPARLVTRDPGSRLRWTIRTLLRFPFDAQGAPGYAVRVWLEGDDLNTHFTHCPPQTFVRHASKIENDPDMLRSFQESWCRFDWPGADLIAGDGRRGHYRRPHTLSYGDAVCDMCWAARGLEQKLQDNEAQNR